MKTYKDTTGLEWTVGFTVYTFKETRPDFGDLLEPEYFLKKTSDAVFMTELLYRLAKGQAEERSITFEKFASSFYGDAVEDARKALLDAYVDFFPSRAREMMTAAIKKIEVLQTEFMKAEAKKLEELTVENAAAISGEDESLN